jgi:hypothetical protein
VLSPWYRAVLWAIYIVTILIVLLTVKLLVTRRRWRHPLRGNGPMLWALIIGLVATEIARAHNLSLGHDNPPPYFPALIAVLAETLLILYWLWRQLELIPRWLRQHVPWRRKRADYTSEEHDRHVGQR